MFHSIREFLFRFEHFGSLVYWFAALAAFLESLAGIGVFIPGTIFVMACGFIAAQGYISVVTLIWSSIIGAVFGDVLSYYLGRKGTQLFRPENKLLTVDLLHRGIEFFKSHGSKSIFIGRFMGPARAIVPFVAGTFHMSVRKFLLWNVISAIGWAIVYVLLGYFFGNAWHALLVWSGWIGAIIAIAVGVVVGVYFLIRFVLSRRKEIHGSTYPATSMTRTAFANNSQLLWPLRKYPGFFAFMKNRFRTDRFQGLPLFLLVVLFAFVLALLLGVVEDVVTSDPIVQLDHKVENFLYTSRSPWLVGFFLWITALGKWQVITSGVITVSILLFLHKKKQYIIPFWLALVGNELMVVLGKLAFHRERPVHAVYVESFYSFPSGHAAVSFVFYGFLAFILIHQIKGWIKRSIIIFLAAVLIIGIGFSRLYLDVHYLSDVWGGYLLGSLWLILAIILAELLHTQSFPENVHANLTYNIKLIDISLIAVELTFCIIFATFNNPL